MDIGIVSVRYAKALLRFATENSEEQQVYAEMETLSAAYRSVPALQVALLNPTLTDRQKSDLLVAACGTEQQVSASTQRFVALVTEKKRADLMLFIAQSYITLYRKSKQIIKGRLVVPVEIRQPLAERLQRMVETATGSSVEFEVCVDDAIGGGFVLEYDTYRLDASLHTQINRMRRALK